MAGINKVIIIGRLGQDPEMKTLAQGSVVTRLNVATSEAWTDKNGQKQERTEWHRISVWGKLAELCGKYLAKGRQVYVEGKLQTRSWEENGQKRYSTEITAQTVQFLGAGAAQGAQQGAYAGTSSNQESGFNQSSPSSSSSSESGFADFGPEPTFDQSEEIPF